MRNDYADADWFFDTAVEIEKHQKAAKEVFHEMAILGKRFRSGDIPEDYDKVRLQLIMTHKLHTSKLMFLRRNFRFAELKSHRVSLLTRIRWWIKAIC